jgi:hypothetical protein
MGVRKEVSELKLLGPFPSEEVADVAMLKKYGDLMDALGGKITDDEARLLVNLFGVDGCFGFSASLIHLIETAPGWPLEDCIYCSENEWIVELRNRSLRGGYSFKRGLEGA